MDFLRFRGGSGSAPIWLFLGTIYIAMILEGRMKIFMLICETEITVDVDKVYVALSGDQCALTNIRISRPE